MEAEHAGGGGGGGSQDPPDGEHGREDGDGSQDGQRGQDGGGQGVQLARGGHCGDHYCVDYRVLGAVHLLTIQ